MIAPSKLSDQVYQHLMRMILAGELTPGSPLTETGLSEQLGVSRTPIREALVRLAEYGVVESRPNHGAVVRRLGREDLVHFHQVREALEGLSAELACPRMTAEDHARLEALAEAARAEEAPGYFEAPKAKEFDVGLHRLVATRSGNPVLAREIFKFHDMSKIVMEQLERACLASGRAAPGQIREILTLELEQHSAIVAALRSRDPAASRRSMVEHIRSICELRARMVPSRTDAFVDAALPRADESPKKGAAVSSSLDA